MKTFKLALTAAAVAMSLGFAESAVVRNDAASLEQMQNRLIELNAEANNIKARAAAEQRDMTDDERKDLDQIFASFEELSADIERLERLDTMNASIAAPAGRRTEADGAPDTQAAANPNQTRAQIESQRQRGIGPCAAARQP